MTDDLQVSIQRRKQRWLDFYDLTRPPTSLFLIRCLDTLPERPLPHPQNMAARMDWIWRKFEQQLDQLTWLEDDTLPFLDLYTGTEIFATAFGCPTYYPENDMPYVLPRIEAAEEVAGLALPDLNGPSIAPVFQMAADLRGRAHDKIGQAALLHMVDLQSPMDVAAMIWDKTRFYPAMIQSPEAVHALAGQVRRFMILFLDEWFARFGREFIAHYPDYYLPQGVSLTEDGVGAISGKMFNAFFMPEIEALSTRYGGVGIYSCANARHQWNNFKKVSGLRMLNLFQPAEVIREAVPFFAEGTPQWLSVAWDGPPWTWPQQAPAGARMVYEIFVNSREEALETSRRMREVLGR